MVKRPQRGLPQREAVLSALNASRHGPLKAKELARVLRVPKERYVAFRQMLRTLVTSGDLFRVSGNRFAVPNKINLVTGRLETVRSGNGFVVSGGGEADVFVSRDDFDSAMDGDRVVARVEGHDRKGRPHGRVIKVLERARQTVVGRFRTGKGFGFVSPRGRGRRQDVVIPRDAEGGARTGDLVVVELTDFGSARTAPVGEVREVLGAADAPGVDVRAILRDHGLPDHFPEEVEKAAAGSALRGLEDRGSRRDLTNDLVFTIDPEDARDHDDALSIRLLPEGAVELGVHIADVSHFVREGEPVDVEAAERGTSVYLVDRVVPMLPEVLSSGVCSLVPDVERLALSLHVRLDSGGKASHPRLERTVLRSRHRLSYETAQAVLDGSQSLDVETDEALRALDRMAKILRARRVERGSLDFDLPETRVLLNAEGAPIDVQRVHRLDSHRLVEECMLLANEAVAKLAEKKDLPIVYRIHEGPDSDRLEALRLVLGRFGYRLPARVSPRSLQRVLAASADTPEEALVSMLVLRSMSRARYAARNAGHFGLASNCYAHFTSPIRRYPDLVTHRVLARTVVDREPAPSSWGGEWLDETADRSSARERLADLAERESVELKKLQYMERHLGDEFQGTVSGVTSFGVFVLLDDVFVDGLVHISSLGDDYYRFLEDEYRLEGERNGRSFQLGQRLHVQVARVDREERRIDFLLVGEKGDR